MDPFEKQFYNLPEERKKQVLDLLNMFQTQSAPKSKKDLKFDWVGCLEELKDTYTSTQLKKKASEWRH